MRKIAFSSPQRDTLARTPVALNVLRQFHRFNAVSCLPWFDYALSIGLHVAAEIFTFNLARLAAIGWWDCVEQKWKIISSAELSRALEPLFSQLKRQTSNKNSVRLLVNFDVWSSLSFVWGEHYNMKKEQSSSSSGTWKFSSHLRILKSDSKQFHILDGNSTMLSHVHTTSTNLFLATFLRQIPDSLCCCLCLV